MREKWKTADLDVLRHPAELELRHGLFWLTVRHGHGRFLKGVG